jgi:hypothetical protein
MEVTGAITALLRVAVDEPYCDRCIAVALREPLSTVQRAIPQLLDATDDYARRLVRCVACGQRATATVYEPAAAARAVKCTRCSRRVNEDPVTEHGDVFHRHCWDVLRSELRIANSRQLARLSRELIRRSRERLTGGGPTPAAG